MAEFSGVFMLLIVIFGIFYAMVPIISFFIICRIDENIKFIKNNLISKNQYDNINNSNDNLF